MGCAFVFRSNSLAGAAVPLCIGPMHGLTGLGLLAADETKSVASIRLSCFRALGVEEFGTKHYRAISASAGVPNVTQITLGKLCLPVLPFWQLAHPQVLGGCLAYSSVDHCRLRRSAAP